MCILDPVRFRSSVPRKSIKGTNSRMLVLRCAILSQRNQSIWIHKDNVLEIEATHWYNTPTQHLFVKERHMHWPLLWPRQQDSLLRLLLNLMRICMSIIQEGVRYLVSERKSQTAGVNVTSFLCSSYNPCQGPLEPFSKTPVPSGFCFELDSSFVKS